MLNTVFIFDNYPFSSPFFKATLCIHIKIFLSQNDRYLPCWAGDCRNVVGKDVCLVIVSDRRAEHGGHATIKNCIGNY